MRTDEFDFDLPREMIAQQPARPRDAARLLDVGPTLRDLGVRDLPGLLRAGDVLVVNDTRVIPARLTGRRGAAAIEITLHRRDDGGDGGDGEIWRAFARPGRRLRSGDMIEFADDFRARVVDKTEAGEVRIAFNGVDLAAALARHGATPLPPYIARKDGALAADAGDYQTLFAAHDGAIAAPTAGLHFTPELVAEIEHNRVRLVAVTLHVGGGTFLPVRTEEIEQHVMHSEYGVITADAAAAINAARAAGGRIIAAGTTALRLLESAAAEDGALSPFAGETDIFITPGYRFRIVDVLLTNFHLPRSTLFMLVAAFAGLEAMKAAYAHAMGAGYRFYSYGDATLLYRGDAP
jgi:S-adenosylmethionine:tRNA ribosyltransferase-isomerase